MLTAIVTIGWKCLCFYIEIRLYLSSVVCPSCRLLDVLFHVFCTLFLWNYKRYGHAHIYTGLGTLFVNNGIDKWTENKIAAKKQSWIFYVIMVFTYVDIT